MNCFKSAALLGLVFCASVSPAAASSVTETTVSQSSNVDSKELRCMTEAVYREAGAEPMRGRYAVAQVIKNRMRSGLFPRSVCGVVHQKGQFTFPKGLGPKKGVAELKLWNQAKEIAVSVMSADVRYVGDDVMYFRSSRMKRPAGLRFMESIGGHSFYAGR